MITLATLTAALLITCACVILRRTATSPRRNERCRP